MNQPTHPELLDAFPAATVDKFVHDRGDLVGRDDVEASIQSGIDVFGHSSRTPSRCAAIGTC